MLDREQEGHTVQACKGRQQNLGLRGVKSKDFRKILAKTQLALSTY